MTGRAADAVEPGKRRRLRVPFASGPDGEALWFPLEVIRGRGDGPTLAVTAGIHGDEYEGPRAIQALARAVDPERLAGTLLLVPVAHLAAFAAGTRTSPLDQVNLARVFPGDPEGTPTLRLADALLREVVAPADALIDLHSGGVRLAFLQVAGFYGGDWALARAMGLPFLWRLPDRAGVLTFEARARGLKVAGCEAGGRGGCLEEDVQAYRGGLLAALRAEGMLEGGGPDPAPARLLEGDWQLAPVGGLAEGHVALGQAVAAGTPLLTIRDPFGEPLAVMTAPFAGLVMGVRHLCTLQAGEWATCVVREGTLP